MESVAIASAPDKEFPKRTAARLDLTGVVFERLTVLSEAPKRTNGTRRWLCRCVCGNEQAVDGGHLRSGRTRSCGCLSREVAADTLRARNTRHGLSTRLNPSSEFEIWRGIKKRCGNPNHKSYARYGGRGIRMCDRWLTSFEAFIADMGVRPSPAHSIDRIDSDGNYEPGNCRWATASEQRRNQAGVRWFVTLAGERLTFVDIATRLAIHPSFLWKRLSRVGVL